eukprot:m.219771 g.219771  ORF g.219771 m.219771 type:complete len:190 (-) comp17236_c0_seq1:1533-2102(-)
MAVKRAELGLKLEEGIDRKMAQEHKYFRCDDCAMFTQDPSLPCPIVKHLDNPEYDPVCTPAVCDNRCHCPSCSSIDPVLLPAYVFVSSESAATDVATPSPPLRYSPMITAQNQVLVWLSDYVADGRQRLLRREDLSVRSLKPSGAKKLINKLSTMYSANPQVMELVTAVGRERNVLCKSEQGTDMLLVR